MTAPTSLLIAVWVVFGLLMLWLAREMIRLQRVQMKLARARACEAIRDTCELYDHTAPEERANALSSLLLRVKATRSQADADLIADVWKAKDEDVLNKTTDSSPG